MNRECCSPYYGVLVRTDEGERRENDDADDNDFGFGLRPGPDRFADDDGGIGDDNDDEKDVVDDGDDNDIDQQDVADDCIYS